jgi:hypothetical protein
MISATDFFGYWKFMSGLHLSASDLEVLAKFAKDYDLAEKYQKELLERAEKP